VRQRSRVVIPRPGVVVAAVIVLPRDRLGGRLLEREPVEALLATTLLQRFLLEGLTDLTPLGSVLLLLLGRQEASSLPSDPIFRNRRPRFLYRRQILYTDLDRVSGRNPEAKELKIIKNNTYQGLESLGGAYRDPVDVLLSEAPHHPLRTPDDLVEGRDSCDIRVPSNDASGVISSSRSQRCVSGSTLRRWNAMTTIPAVNPR
jgi:hypothetical protein